MSIHQLVEKQMKCKAEMINLMTFSSLEAFRHNRGKSSEMAILGHFELLFEASKNF